VPTRVIALPAIFSLLLVCSGAPAVAQESSTQTEDVIRVRTDLVTVPAIVTDVQGRRVFGLARQDFDVSSDKRRVNIEFFAAGSDRVALAFLLDSSGSSRGYVLQQREAALSLFSRFGPKSEVMVLHFDQQVEIGTPFTTDPERARRGFQFPAISNRRTAIFDAALETLRLFRERNKAPTERRIVILTSDGLDTASSAKPDEVIRRAQQEAVSFYVIHFPLFSPRDGQLAPRTPAKGFRALAEKTGGRYFMVGDARLALEPSPFYDLSPIFRAIEEDLDGQYLLGFYPDEGSRDDNLHRIEVKVTKNDRVLYRVKLLREEYRLKGP